MASQYNGTTSALLSQAQSSISNALMIAARIGGARTPNLKERRFRHDVRAINLDPPPKFSDVFDGADSSDALIAGLNDKVDAWLAKYFPSINGQFQNVPEDYLVGVISGVRPFGLDATVFDLVWHRARDRAYRTATSEQRTLAAAFSARGFGLPPGAMADAIAQSEQRATAAALEVNREQAVKDAEIKADLLKHAVSTAAQLKQGILNTSAEFFRNYYSAHGLGNETARIRAAAYQSYYGALASYYNVEIAWENLRMDSAKTTAEVDGAIDRNRVSLYSGNGVPAAHAQASRGMAEIAASSAAAAGTLVAQIENI